MATFDIFTDLIKHYNGSNDDKIKLCNNFSAYVSGARQYLLDILHVINKKSNMYMYNDNITHLTCDDIYNKFNESHYNLKIHKIKNEIRNLANINFEDLQILKPELEKIKFNNNEYNITMLFFYKCGIVDTFTELYMTYKNKCDILDKLIKIKNYHLCLINDNMKIISKM